MRSWQRLARPVAALAAVFVVDPATTLGCNAFVDRSAAAQAYHDLVSAPYFNPPMPYPAAAPR